jgi:hypothetical protein
LKKKLKLAIFSFVLLVSSLACEPAVENLVGPSTSGFIVGITAHYGGIGIVVSSGTATIRIEVFTAGGVPVNGAIVAVSTTLGTLGAASLTTVNGVITTSVPTVSGAVKDVVMTPFTVVKEAAPSVPKVVDTATIAPLTGTPPAVNTSIRMVAVPELTTMPIPP